jgi:hypothetical protein
MAKAAAKTGIMPMVLVAVEQYLPKEQRVILSELPRGLRLADHR